MRLFIAIELTAEVKKLLARLQTAIPGARWVPAEQLHLTLAFLGEVDEVTCELLSRKLTEIFAAGFTLHFSGTGCFPDRRRPRVIWAGLSPSPKLTGLAGLVSNAVLSCDIPQEERPFSPHITLARCSQPASREVSTFLEQHRQLKLPPVKVREFILFQSRLTQQGATHIQLGQFPLSA